MGISNSCVVGNHNLEGSNGTAKTLVPYPGNTHPESKDKLSCHLHRLAEWLSLHRLAELLRISMRGPSLQIGYSGGQSS
jgi:hypothetical protein